VGQKDIKRVIKKLLLVDGEMEVYWSKMSAAKQQDKLRLQSRLVYSAMGKFARQTQLVFYIACWSFHR
jgi:hypothetical protein